ncbi:MAG TPA: DUF3626 domain-containing protein [Firmicutes bacterium]|nr:DUF3626 domain-containing protein [Bacillota bacterium]
MVQLTSAQAKALRNVTKYARRHKPAAERQIEHILKMANVPWELFREAKEKVFKGARVALHFHPDRLAANGESVAGNLLESGVYKNQFETSISAGSLTARKGGLRHQHEQKLFGGAYNRWAVKGHHRPKYGALDLTFSADGPSPRFGSCFLLLKPQISWRSTFTYLDSFTLPQSKGTYAEFDLIWSALLLDLFQSRSALGKKDVTVRGFLESLLENVGSPHRQPHLGEASRNLDHYIEAQVHGPVSLSSDSELLVADPSFKNTSVGHELQRLSAKYKVRLLWHMGFAMAVAEIPPDFRGAGMPSLAKRIAGEGVLTTEMIGRAVANLTKHPSAWAKRGSYAEVLQELKLLWHVLL